MSHSKELEAPEMPDVTATVPWLRVARSRVSLILLMPPYALATALAISAALLSLLAAAATGAGLSPTERAGEGAAKTSNATSSQGATLEA